MLVSFTLHGYTSSLTSYVIINKLHELYKRTKQLRASCTYCCLYGQGIIPKVISHREIPVIYIFRIFDWKHKTEAMAEYHILLSIASIVQLCVIISTHVNSNPTEKVPNNEGSPYMKTNSNTGMSHTKDGLSVWNMFKMKPWYLDEKKAKTVAIPGSRKLLGIFDFLEGACSDTCEREKRREPVERQREQSERQSEQHCRVGCWAGWEAWKTCSKNCGAYGTQSRHRGKRLTCGTGCPGPSSQTQDCNRFCPNGGTPTAAGGTHAPCACTNDFQGECCEIQVRISQGEGRNCIPTALSFL